MKRIWKIYCAMILLLLVSGCRDGAALYGTGIEETPAVSVVPEEAAPISGDEDVPEKTQKIWVDVCGEVQRPGVYSLNAGSRVFEAVEAAGGFTKEADAKSLNQAEFLQDGQKLIVWSREEAAKRQEEQKVQETDEDGRVNLNTAAKSELMSLPGIGEVRADAIIAYREAHGGFEGIDEIKQIEGIKDSVFEKIKDRIMV